MKICFIANAQSIHTKRWVDYFVSLGHELHIISEWPCKINNTAVYHFIPKSSKFFLFRLVLNIIDGLRLRRIIKKIKPQIIHFHFLRIQPFYIIGLAGEKKLLISIWGSDIIDDKNLPFYKRLYIKSARKYLLKQAKVITVTSHFLAKETSKYTNKEIHIVPFGVDLDLFKPLIHPKNQINITIGFFKSLKPKYGCIYLILAFSEVIKKHPQCQLLIAGSGTDEQKKELMNIVKEKKLENNIRFLGQLNYGDVAQQTRNCDIVVMPSIYESESFGVAAIEASASEVPVIATNVGGVPEVVINNKTGYLVQPKNVDELTNKLLVLIKNPQLRQQMGKEGRNFVLNKYQWLSNASLMANLYKFYDFSEK